ncbi:cupin domain-containing protein [Xanthobacter sp. AM11]|uniref:cupin domain-containing protein n=1 Tax=Xanthobacter sp. AM11 TaxID=3380643 RepID=UPI0039BF5BD8
MEAGDIWYVPPGYPHSLQGPGPDGCEFVIAFDDGRQSEYNTLLVTDWRTHTPPVPVAQHLNLDPAAIARLPSGHPPPYGVESGATPGARGCRHRLPRRRRAVKGPPAALPSGPSTAPGPSAPG